MKKLYALVVLLTAAAQAQIVNIPDPNFKARLLGATTSNDYAQDAGGNSVVIDVNADNEIQASEAAAVYKLNLDNAGILNFQGLEAFTGLHVLRAGMNNAVTIDLSALTALEDFNASPSNLTGIDVSMLLNLKSLAVYGPDIASIDVSNNIQLTYLYVAGCGLSSLDVSNLTALTFLDCDTNNLTALDLSNNIALQELHCVSNQIASLDVSMLPQLVELQCATNPIAALNVSQNPNLQTLDIGQCQVSSISLSANPQLAILFCGHNPMPSIDVSQNPLLQIFHCENNGMASVDVSANPQLYNLDVSGNQLTTLDIHSNPSLAYLDCSNNQLTAIDTSIAHSLNAFYCEGNLFTTLDVTQNPLLCFFNPRNLPALQTIFMKNGNDGCPLEFQITNDPALYYVCTDDAEVSHFTQFFSDNAMTVTVNSYCTFTPGGPYNTITGTALFDANGNGCGPDDLPQPFVKVQMTDGTDNGAAFTTVSGQYTFYTGVGNFTLTPDIENPAFFNLSPTTSTISFPTVSGITQTQDFCISANGVHHDTEVVFAPETVARPGFTARYRLVYRNKGNQQESGTVTLTYDAARLQWLTASVPPTTNAGNTITFDFSGLMPFESRAVVLEFHVSAPGDTPPVNVGDYLDFSASVTDMFVDEVPNDNNIELHQLVVGSLDPNDITCVEGSVLSTTEIGNYLHYIVNFENTGTAEAQNIVIRCAVDPDQYDINSLRVENSSSPAEVRVTGNVVEYILKNIHLEIGGHGNILLKIRSDNGLANGSSVSQRAEIFFDYNLPVGTNDATTTYQALSVGQHGQDTSVSVFPNPVSGITHVKASTEIRSLELYDVQGRLLQVSHPDAAIFALDMSSRQAGLYFAKIATDKGTAIQKVIVE